MPDRAASRSHIGGHRKPGRPGRVLFRSQCLIELLAAVTSLGTENIAGQALRVDPDEDLLPVADVTHHEGDVLAIVDQGAIAHGTELAVPGGYPGLHHALDQALLLAAIGDEVGDGADQQRMLFGEGHQLGKPGHGAVVVHDLCEVQTGQLGEFHGRLGVAGAFHHAAWFVAEGIHVPGTRQVGGL